MPTLYQTIVRPIVTEQSSMAYQERGEYTFEVHPEATKPAIRQAVEQLWGVKVTGVWTSQQRGRARAVGLDDQRVGGRHVVVGDLDLEIGPAAVAGEQQA